MDFHNNAPRSIANLRLDPTGEDGLCAAFARIAEPCDRQPEVYIQTRHGTRAPHRALLKYFAQAFDAASTVQKRRQVIERINGFLDECAAYIRSWILDGSPLDRRDIFETAQHADGHEDTAEVLYLLNPCRATATGLIEAGRIDRERSTQREIYLLRSTDPRPAA